MKTWIHAATVFCLWAHVGLAHAGKPPIFKPSTPPDWSYQQKQIVNQALDVLFDKCPSIDKYLPDIQDASVGIQNMSLKVVRKSSPRFWRDHHWDKVLTLDVTVPQNPSSPYLPKGGKLGSMIAFFMGAGDRPGIYIQTSAMGKTPNPAGVCGAKHVAYIKTPGIPDLGLPPSKDTFIPAPKLRLVKQLN